MLGLRRGLGFRLGLDLDRFVLVLGLRLGDPHHRLVGEHVVGDVGKGDLIVDDHRRIIAEVVRRPGDGRRLRRLPGLRLGNVRDILDRRDWVSLQASRLDRRLRRRSGGELCRRIGEGRIELGTQRLVGCRLRHRIDRTVGRLLVEHEIVVVGEVLGIAGLRLGQGLHGAQGRGAPQRAAAVSGRGSRCSLIIRLQPTEFAHQFAFEVDRQIVAGSLDRRRLLAHHRDARVEAHDAGQLRKGIVVLEVYRLGSTLADVCLP